MGRPVWAGLHGEDCLWQRVGTAANCSGLLLKLFCRTSAGEVDRARLGGWDFLETSAIFWPGNVPRAWSGNLTGFGLNGLCLQFPGSRTTMWGGGRTDAHGDSLLGYPSFDDDEEHEDAQMEDAIEVVVEEEEQEEEVEEECWWPCEWRTELAMQGDWDMTSLSSWGRLGCLVGDGLGRHLLMQVPMASGSQITIPLRMLGGEGRTKPKEEGARGSTGQSRRSS